MVRGFWFVGTPLPLYLHQTLSLLYRADLGS
jgi:hypothetical protein